MTDFIIVGRGLAATVLAHTFHKNNISFKVIGEAHLSNCSRIAAGIWNPVVFKRLTPSWLAHQTIPFLNTFYSECEKRTGTTFVYHRNIVKPFVQDQEKQLWLKKSNNELEEFLGDIISSENLNLRKCNIHGDCGLVKQSGNIDVAKFIDASEYYFKENYIAETFDYTLLSNTEKFVSYKTLTAKNIIFCEGYLIKNNPFFNWVPLKPAKGEVLTIETKSLGLDEKILNKGAFILQTGENTFKTGATYEWDNLDEKVTTEALEQLETKLKEMISAEYTILKQEAGVRPSARDRRPIIGPHPLHANMHVFNGLGTKGVMLAPYFANNFVLFYLQKQALNPEINIKRFYNLFKSAE